MESLEPKILGFEGNNAIIISKKLIEHKIKIDSFNNRYETVYNEFSELGFVDASIKKILIQEPRVIYCIGNIKSRLDNMKNKILTNKETDLDIIPRALIFKEETLTNKYNTLIGLGFKKSEIQNILIKDPKFITRKAKTVAKCFDFFKSIGLNTKKTIKIFQDHSKDIARNSKNLELNFSKIISCGFTKDEACKLVSNLPTILFNHLDKIEKCFDFFESLGQEKNITKEKILSFTSLIIIKEENYLKLRNDLSKKGLSDEAINLITLKAYEIVTYTKSIINYLYQTFYNYGFDNKDINKIILKNPEILYHKIEKIDETLKLLTSYNINKEDLIKITTNHPMLFESNIDSIDEKMSLIFSLDLYDSIIKNPKNLIQGCEKTFLRYMYVSNELNKEINTSNDRLIFASKPNNIPDIEKLRTMYSYTKYKDDNLLEMLEEDFVEAKSLK